MDTTLEHYYSLVDGGAVDEGLRLLAPNVEFAILLPTEPVRGRAREDMRAYLDGRGEVVRRHLPIRSARVDDVEFVYGSVVEGEAVTTGHFSAVARVRDGLVTRYLVAFDPELALFPPEG